jgi:hypothetical protein
VRQRDDGTCQVVLGRKPETRIGDLQRVVVRRRFAQHLGKRQ